MTRGQVPGTREIKRAVLGRPPCYFVWWSLSAYHPSCIRLFSTLQCISCAYLDILLPIGFWKIHNAARLRISCRKSRTARLGIRSGSVIRKIRIDGIHSKNCSSTPLLHIIFYPLTSTYPHPLSATTPRSSYPHTQPTPPKTPPSQQSALGSSPYCSTRLKRQSRAQRPRQQPAAYAHRSRML